MLFVGCLTSQEPQSNHAARSAKILPSQSYKRRCVACQHSPDDQILWLQAGAGEDDFIHLLSGTDHVACQRQRRKKKLKVQDRGPPRWPNG